MVMIRPETEMKDSGIEWIGDIPSSWTIFPANGVFSEVKEKNMDLKFTNAFSFKYGEIVDKKQVGDVDNNLKETLSSYTIVRKNTIMINGLNLNYDFVSQRVAIVNESGVITSAYLAIQPDENKINPKFVLYLLKSYDYQQVFHGLGSGIRKTLKYQDFKKIMIVAPTLSEQQDIADYLDETCSKIDEIIAEAKASIDEYKELKQSVIFEAVTKGLNKNVEMKDSGVEWIGEIPVDWVVKKFKYVATVNTNLVSPIGYEDYHQIAPDCIEKDSGRLIKERTVSEAGVESWNQLFKQGQLIYSKIRPTLNKVIIAPYDGLCSADMYPLDVHENIHFVQFAMLSKYFVGQVGLITQDRVKMPKINQDELSNVYVAVPERTEQQKIVDWLNEQLPRYDSLIAEKESLINDLEAYKKSLIYEVVTGKRRVV